MKAFFLLFVLTCLSAQAAWQTTQRRDFTDSTGKVHASELHLMDGEINVDAQIVYFWPHEIRFQVVPNLRGEIEGIRSAVEATGGIAGINGGYFEADLSPLGLLISDSRVLHSTQKAKLLSGVFLVRGGRPQIIRTRELAGINGIEQAIQCGPFLVDGGQPVAGLEREKVAARSFVFTCGPSCWGFGICRSITLAQTAELLASAELITGFRIREALNLDGGSSTALYAKLGNHEIFSEGRPAVSNYLIIRLSLAPG